MDAGPTFIELAQAVRETHTIGLQVVARLAGVADPEELEVMRARKQRLLEAANLLVEFAPHEPLIRSIVRVGGLAELPEYSPDLSALRVGATGLWRGEVLDVHPTECEVAFHVRRTSRGVRQTTQAWISRADLVGLQLITPSMWMPAPRR